MATADATKPGNGSSNTITAIHEPTTDTTWYFRDNSVPDWAKQSTKPTYTYTEVGASPASHATNSTIHVTSTDKTNWNNKLSSITSSMVETALGFKPASDDVYESIAVRMYEVSDDDYTIIDINSGEYVGIFDIYDMYYNNSARLIFFNREKIYQIGQFFIDDTVSPNPTKLTLINIGAEYDDNIADNLVKINYIFIECDEFNSIIDFKIDSLDIEEHLTNNSKHVTSTDKSKWNNKQDALTPGTGIKIENGVISVSFANGDGVSY